MPRFQFVKKLEILKYDLLIHFRAVVHNYFDATFEALWTGVTHLCDSNMNLSLEYLFFSEQTHEIPDVLEFLSQSVLNANQVFMYVCRYNLLI